MADRKFSWTEKQLEARLLIEAFAFHAIGLEQAANLMRGNAGNAFSIGRDQEASILRDWGLKFDLLAKEKRRAQKEHQEEYDKKYDD